ncbi:serine carboxypeptidase-like protein 26 [Cinnamomum micranthum f. kanehirae]|nr:serine carboxypeptidase-like protein 26 [Cinnamomum micranthum f. kanehirae]
MEKKMKWKKEDVFFFHVNQLLFLVVVFMVVGSCHGYRLNQAGKLQALLKVKKQNGTREEWATPTWVGDGPSEGGAMELDLITNGLPGQPSSVNFKQYAGYITV